MRLSGLEPGQNRARAAGVHDVVGAVEYPDAVDSGAVQTRRPTQQTFTAGRHVAMTLHLGDADGVGWGREEAVESDAHRGGAQSQRRTGDR